MTPLQDPRNRLQPALLDRLIDDTHQHASSPAGHANVMTRQQLRQAVLRDLTALFNTTQALGAMGDEMPVLRDSVLNYGLPALAGKPASQIDVDALAASIRLAIVRFEPRILADTLAVQAVEPDSALDAHNQIEFEIRGQLWGQPLPLEVLLRTRLNLEAGQAVVLDTTATAAPARPAALPQPRP